MTRCLSARLILGACLAALAVAVVAAIQQTPATDVTGAGSMIGRVVDVSNGQPIPGAIVMLTLTPKNPAAGGLNLAASSLANIGTTIIVGPGTNFTSLQITSPRIVTDAAGGFAFRHLPAGTYMFETTAHGYSGGEYRQLQPDGPGQTIELGDGQQMADTAIQMWKDAAISGRVVDETGDPLVGVLVRVLRRVTSGGQPALQQSGRGQSTDDRGIYRAHGLTPGDYVVMVPSTISTVPAAMPGAALPGRAGGGPNVSGGRGETGLSIGDFSVSARSVGSSGGLTAPPPGADGKFFAYQTTYYPAAISSSRAATVTVSSGEEKGGIDLQLALTTTFRVTGTVSEADGSPAANLPIRLMSLDADQGRDTSPDSIASTATSGTGAFTLIGVPPGQYVLLAQRVGMRGRGAGPATTSAVDPSSWARLTVSVADADTTGLAIVLRPGFQVKGRLAFDGVTPPPDASQQVVRQPVYLTPLSGTTAQCGTGRAGGVPPGPDGSFVIAGCLPGRYLFVPPPVQNWQLRSATADGRDVSDVPIEITDEDVANVLATYTDRPAQVTGTVHTLSGELDPKALVVLFSTDPRAWGWPSGLHRASARSTAQGTFTMAHLAPGDYYIAAIPGDAPGNWNTPKVLEQLAATAVRIHLDDGGHATEDLKTSVIK